MTPSKRLPRPRALVLLGLAALLGAALLGCTTGTPAAPEGSKIFLTFGYAAQDFDTGDYEAVIVARVLDEVSDVPQTGVGVFFRVSSGPGSFIESDAVRTDNDGIAQNVLIGSGEVTLVVSSGVSEAELTLDVNSGTSPEVQLPDACFTVDQSGTGNSVVTVDVGCSEAPECADEEPDTFTVDWGDGATDNDLPFSQGDVMHTYQPGSWDIVVSVSDCQGLTDTAPTRTITVN